ncbi:MAG: aminotransferase class III-fold pyridoxal phosphate-dependent enzyme [Phycisphaerae bacterium]|jgi:glutamate-1-semialdehyde 2,1-aminomutase|nr:aminotransferase class III-fold pyridoxal phosphate-dependent enzyme [Phycisphaerae bacterium]
MNTIAIVQARMGSTRFPNKVMQLINGVPMIELLLARLADSEKITKIVLATSKDPRNQSLVDHVQSLGIQVYQGSEHDVLDRYYQVATQQEADTIVRITGDCPLVDSKIVDAAIAMFKENGVDYVSNVIPPTFPDGLDVEVFGYNALVQAWNNSTDSLEREHVTQYIQESNQFNKACLSHCEDLSQQRWTVDEPEDFEVIKNIFNHFSPNKNFGWLEVVKLSHDEPSIFIPNQHVCRNEGATMGTGQKLWKRAKSIIPGGNMLLSKRAEMFLPNQWPAYYSKASGCTVWDLDGKEFIDMSIMGVGTNILGYGNPEVDEAVQRAVTLGNMSTLNCPEEVALAEKLIEMHPWADMVRLARTGGEANAVAIRIARAASGKDNVAICGYHGWHDWYLSANIGSDESLDDHLLPGLEPKGVPQNLKGTVFPFHYNNFEELETIVRDHDIGVIKMEVSRNEGPQDNFLQKVRKLATDNNIVLVFDECTSGFRETFGGLHLKYGVDPDIALFGKALGNGYAITAIIGRREIMESAQSTFISSTFWTERIGPSAALKTLEVMEQTKSWELITNIGLDIRNKWQELADTHGLEIEHWGLPALTGFTFTGKNAIAYKTLITQEMLQSGYLAGNCVYACTAHTDEIIEGFFATLDPIFGLIKQCEEGLDVNKLLSGPICHSGFKRLN